MGECTRIWCISPSSNDLLFVKTVFIKRKIFESIRRNLEIHKTLLAGPSDCLPAKKGGKASLPVWLTKTWSGVFLKHRAASPPLSQTLSTGQRRPSSAGGTPSGGGWCSLSRALWRTFWAVESIKFMQKILKVYLSWRSDQFCWINGKKEPICQELHIIPSIILNIIHSLFTDCKKQFNAC